LGRKPIAGRPLPRRKQHAPRALSNGGGRPTGRGMETCLPVGSIHGSAKETILIRRGRAGTRARPQMILKPYYDVYTAERGEAALAILKSTPIDVVTLDLAHAGGSRVMPLLQKMKDHDPDHRGDHHHRLRVARDGGRKHQTSKGLRLRVEAVRRARDPRDYQARRCNKTPQSAKAPPHQGRVLRETSRTSSVPRSRRSWATARSCSTSMAPRSPPTSAHAARPPSSPNSHEPPVVRRRHLLPSRRSRRARSRSRRGRSNCAPDPHLDPRPPRPRPFRDKKVALEASAKFSALPIRSRRGEGREDRRDVAVERAQVHGRRLGPPSTRRCCRTRRSRSAVPRHRHRAIAFPREVNEVPRRVQAGRSDGAGKRFRGIGLGLRLVTRPHRGDRRQPRCREQRSAPGERVHRSTCPPSVEEPEQPGAEPTDMIATMGGVGAQSTGVGNDRPPVSSAGRDCEGISSVPHRSTGAPPSTT